MAAEANTPSGGGGSSGGTADPNVRVWKAQALGLQADLDAAYQDLAARNNGVVLYICVWVVFVFFVFFLFLFLFFFLLVFFSFFLVLVCILVSCLALGSLADCLGTPLNAPPTFFAGCGTTTLRRGGGSECQSPRGRVGGDGGPKAGSGAGDQVRSPVDPHRGLECGRWGVTIPFL